MTKERLEFLSNRYKSRDLKTELRYMTYNMPTTRQYMSAQDREFLVWLFYSALNRIENLESKIENLKSDNEYLNESLIREMHREDE